ncbi:MAG: hypothetical protein NZ578_02975 [Candidatus Binatia bacterium]|nr:hypothetical protein [Candidatus Binatia bacterium]
MHSVRLLSLCTVVGLLALFPGPALRADGDAEVEALRRQVQSLQRTVEDLQRTLATLQRETAAREEKLQQHVETAVRQARAAQIESPLDQAVRELEREEQRPVDLLSRRIGGANVRLIDISFIPSLFAGSSTATDRELQTLQGGGHDPRKRGFTLADGELGFSGAVDPYLRGQVFVTYFIDALSGETGVELEEAFLTSQRLPLGLELKAGHFLTEFGLINPRHPHQWDWIDQPVINNRLFGPDGMRAPGVRLGWLLPTAWFSQLYVGMQNANGETMTSFLGGRHQHGGAEEAGHDEEHEHGALDDRMIGNRPLVERATRTRSLKDFVYLTRWEHSWGFGEELTTLVGLSGLYGPNATGRNGDTWIYGLAMKWRWRPVRNFRGWPFVTWQTEVMQRDFHADRFVLIDDADGDALTFPGRTLHDWGLYTQGLFGFTYGWAAGVRYEYAGGSGQSIGGRRNDPFRTDRHRVSPLLVWQPTEFTRIRLQYNYDRTRFGNGSRNAHSVWLGFQWLLGTHPPHEY